MPKPANSILKDIEERFRRLLLKRLHRAEPADDGREEQAVIHWDLKLANVKRRLSARLGHSRCSSSGHGLSAGSLPPSASNVG